MPYDVKPYKRVVILLAEALHELPIDDPTGVRARIEGIFHDLNIEIPTLEQGA